MNRKYRILLLCGYFYLSLTIFSTAQTFYFGADLSYVNEMEDCGAIYKENGLPKNPYTIFKDHGCNLVRLRLWHTPAWYDALNDGNRYSDLLDVRRSIQRAKQEGMQVLLDYHLSDTWADPGHQVAPAAWTGVLNDLEVLKDSLYNYIYSTLSVLAAENLLPEMVQIGNETNKGILQSQQSNDAGWSLNWSRNSALFNTAIEAVRDIEVAFNADIKVALHVADPDDVDWLMAQFWSNGVQDFDVIGLSYYYSFHDVLIPFVGNTITELKNLYPGKEVLLLETAYPWTNSNADGANNVLGAGYPGFNPPTVARQLEWLTTLTQEVIDHGGDGIVYWEPAWVSTNCSTQWAQGSHWDNATFFNTNDELQLTGGIGWMLHTYDFTISTEETSSKYSSLKIYVADDELVIEKTNDILLHAPVTLELHGVDGKLILSRTIGWSEDTDLIRVSLKMMVPGSYVANLRDMRQVVKSGLVIVQGTER